MRVALGALMLAGCAGSEPAAEKFDETEAACAAAVSCGIYAPMTMDVCVRHWGPLDGIFAIESTRLAGISREQRGCLAGASGCRGVHACLGDEAACEGESPRCDREGNHVIWCQPTSQGSFALYQDCATSGLICAGTSPECALRCEGSDRSCAGSFLVSGCADGYGSPLWDCASHGATCTRTAGGADCVGDGAPCSGGSLCEGDVLVECMGGREARARCPKRCGPVYSDVIGDIRVACTELEPCRELPRCEGSAVVFCSVRYDCALHGFAGCRAGLCY